MSKERTPVRPDFQLAKHTREAARDNVIKWGFLTPLAVVAFPGWVPLTWPFALAMGGAATFYYVRERAHRHQMHNEATRLHEQGYSSPLVEAALSNTTKDGRRSKFSWEVISEANKVYGEANGQTITARRYTDFLEF